MSSFLLTLDVSTEKQTTYQTPRNYRQTFGVRGGASFWSSQGCESFDSNWLVYGLDGDSIHQKTPTFLHQQLIHPKVTLPPPLCPVEASLFLCFLETRTPLGHPFHLSRQLLRVATPYLRLSPWRTGTGLPSFPRLLDHYSHFRLIRTEHSTVETKSVHTFYPCDSIHVCASYACTCSRVYLANMYMYV